MKSPLFRLLPFAALLLPLQAQSDKARNFYEALRKRPAAQALFDQFYNAWLDTETVEELETFLTAEAEKSREAGMILAVFYARQGELDKSAAAWRAVLEAAPGRADAWLALAEVEARQRRNDDALEAVESGLNTNPSPDLERRLLEFKARTLARGNKRAEARAVWETLLKAHPDDEDLRDDYIDLLAQTGDMRAAIKAAADLADATSDPYRRVLRRARLGDLLAGGGDIVESLAAYAAGMADTGAGSWLEKDLLRQIEALFRGSDNLDALAKFLRDLASKEPRRLAVRRLLAQVLTDQDKKSEADAVWQGLIAAAPGDRGIAEAFIQHLTRTRRHAEAAAQWRALIALHPADAELHLQLATALHAARDDHACAAAVRDYLRAAGNTEEASLRAAAELSKFKLAAEALTLLAETAQKFPGSESARLQWASALHGADKKEEARAAWRVEAARPGRLLPVARAALAHGEHVLAWQLLEPRLQEFDTDPAALTVVCDAAMRAEKWAAGMARGQRLMALAPDAVALGDALTVTLRMAERGRLRDSLRQQLEARRAQLSPAECCLLAEILQTSGDRAGAAALLEDVSGREPSLGLALLVRLHVVARDFKAAAHAQLRLVNAPGGHKPLHLQRLTELYADAKLFADALHWVAEWKKLAPGSTAPWLREASLHQLSGKTAESVKVLEQAAHLWPDDPDVLSRFATALTAAEQPARAQHVYMRLFEKAADTGEKLRWLSPLTNSAAASGQLEALITEFQRRRGQNRQSPVPLLGLAECYARSGNDVARLEAMRDAARLGEGDTALLIRAAESAVESGRLEMADSILAEAAAKDKSGEVIQQRVAVLLHLGRNDEAAALLSQLAAGIGEEDSVELALTLSQVGHPQAAAAFLRQVSARIPDNYRLAWVAVQLTLDVDEDAIALTELLRLATASLPPMPEAPPLPSGFLSALQQQQQQQQLQGQWSGNIRSTLTWGDRSIPYAATVLSPVPDDTPAPPPGSDEEQASILRAMLERPRGQEQQSAASSTVGPLIPGSLRELRGRAAGEALRLAREQGPDRVAAVKAALLAAGMRPAIFSDIIAAGKTIGLEYPHEKPDIATAGADTGWLLRFLLGTPPVMKMPDAPASAPSPDPFDEEYSPSPNVRTSAYGSLAQRPAALAAWRHYRESDPAYAIYAALMLLGSDVPAEREAAAAALTLLEQRETPGPLLSAALKAIESSAAASAVPRSASQPSAFELHARLMARVTRWHQAVPPGPERDWLRHHLLLTLANGADPAAYLELIVDEVAAGAPGASLVSGPRDSAASVPSPGNRIVWMSNTVPSARGVRLVRTSGTQARPTAAPRQTSAPDVQNILPLPGRRLLLSPVAMAPAEQTSAGALDAPLSRTAARLSPGPWSADPAKLRAAVAQCRHAGVKAVASLLVMDETFSDACMKALSLEQPPVAEHLITAAAWEWRHRRPAEAIALLERAAALEPDNAVKPADTAIAGALNLLLWSRAPLPDSARPAVVAALERLAGQPLDESVRPGLAGLAEELNETNLADAIQVTPSPAHPVPSIAVKTQPLANLISSLQRARNYGIRRPRGEPLTPEQEAARLVAAARSSLTSSQAPAVSAPQQYYQVTSGSAVRLGPRGARVKGSEPDPDAGSKLDQAIKNLAGNSRDPVEILAAGIALLNRADALSFHYKECLKLIERAVAMAPEDHRLCHMATRAMLAAPLQADDIVPAVIKLSAGLPAVERSTVFAQAANHFSFGFPFDDTSPGTVILELMEAWTSALREIPAEKADGHSLNLPVALTLLRQAEIPRNARGRQPPAVPVEETKEQAARRGELSAALCRELMRFPQTAENAFEWAMTQVNAGNWKWENIRGDALAVLKLKPAVTAEIPLPQWPSRSTDPAEVVFVEAAADSAWLEKTVLPSLLAAGRDLQADGFKRLLPLLQCEPAGFAAVAGRLAREVPPADRHAVVCQAAIVAGIRGIGGLLPDLTGTAITAFRGSIPPGIVVATLQHLHAHGGDAAVSAWVQSVCGEPRPADIWTRPLSAQGLPGQGFVVLSGLLSHEGFTDNNSGGATLLLRALQHPLLALPPDIPAALNVAFLERVSKRSSGEIIALLDAAGFLADLPDFRPMLQVFSDRDPSDFDGGTLRCGNLIRQNLTKDANPGATSPLLDKLTESYAHTFGGRLAAAFVRESSPYAAASGDGVRPPEVLRVIAADLQRLQALPEDQQLDFVALNPHNGPGSNEALQAAEEWLEGLKGRTIRRLFERLSALSDSDLLKEPDLSVRLSKICTFYLPEEPEKVLSLLARIGRLPGTGFKDPDVADLLASSVANWSYDAPPSAQARRLRALLTILGDGHSILPEPWRIADHTEGLLKRWLMPGSMKMEDFSLPGSLPVLLARLEGVPDDFLTEKQARLLLPVALNLAVFTGRTGDPGVVSAKTAEMLEKPGAGGRLRRVLVDAFRLAELNFRRNAEVAAALAQMREFARSDSAKGYALADPGFNLPLPGVLTAEALPECQKHLLQSLTDEDIPRTTRRILFIGPQARIPRIFDPPLLTASAALLEVNGTAGPITRERETRAAAAVAGAAASFLPPVPEAEREAVRCLLDNANKGASFEDNILTVAARSADDETLLRLATMVAGHEERRLAGFFRSLVHLRRFPVAAKLLTDFPDRLFPPPGTIFSTRELTGPDTDAAVAEFVATLPEEPVRTAARALMASGFDAPERVAAGAPPRMARLDALAKSIAGENLPLEWLQRALLVFDQSFAGRAALEPLLERAVRGGRLPDVMNAPPNMQELYYRHLQAIVERGEMQPLVQAAADLSRVPPVVRTSARARLWALFITTVEECGAKWPQESRRGALEFLRVAALDTGDLLKRLNSGGSEAIARDLAFALVMHAAWDAMPALESALAAMAEADCQKLWEQPATAGFVLELLSVPAAEPFVSKLDLTWRPVPVQQSGAVLARILAGAHGLPGLEMGLLHEFVTVQEKEFDVTPVLALAPDFLRRPDNTAAAALWDVTLLLAEAKRPEEARRSLPLLEQRFAGWCAENAPREQLADRVTAAFAFLFSIYSAMDGPAAGLAHALQNGPFLDKMPAGRVPESLVVALHVRLNMADAELLKSDGPEKWKQQALARLGAAPESALAFFHSACVLEKLAGLESAAGRHQEAFTVMSLAVLSASYTGFLNSGLLDTNSKEIFVANYADLAVRAGKKMEFVELLPLGSEWYPRLTGVADSLSADGWKAARAPLGWNAEGLASTLAKPKPEKNWPDPRLQLRCDVKLPDIVNGDELGIVYSTFCDLEDPTQSFRLGNDTLIWSESGRPERTPDLTTLTGGAKTAAGAINPRTTLLGPLWLKGDQKRRVEVTIDLKSRKRESLHFDGALHALKLTFARAVEQADARYSELEAAAPEFWKHLPGWLRRK